MNTGTPGILINEDTTIAVANAEFLNLVRLTEEELAQNPSWMRFFMAQDAEASWNIIAAGAWTPIPSQDPTRSGFGMRKTIFITRG